MTDAQKQDDALNLSGLCLALPSKTTLSAEDRSGLVSSIASKLESLAGKQTDVMESLSPTVKKRVEFLRELQGQHDELEAKFFEEKAALEAKYQALYQPMYTKRFEVVNGITEVGGILNEMNHAASNMEDKEKGIPEFWLTALKANEVIADEIQERDEEVLKYLKDIKWYRMEDPKGFKLEFHFDSNPFFKNTILTKAYHMIDEDDPVLEKAIGTEIEWLPGKCVTKKVMKKKPKKGSKNQKIITKTEDCESFFNFFNPPIVPENDDDLDEDAAEDLQNRMEQDYDVGSIIRDKIIPHAVSWFTGEAVEEDFEAVEEDEDIDDDDDEEDEDEDEEDEEGVKTVKKIQGGNAGGAQPTDCNQQ